MVWCRTVPQCVAEYVCVTSFAGELNRARCMRVELGIIFRERTQMATGKDSEISTIRAIDIA